MLQYSSIVFTWPYSMRFILDKKSPVLCRIAGSTFCPSPVKELLDFSAKLGRFGIPPQKKQNPVARGMSPIRNCHGNGHFYGSNQVKFHQVSDSKTSKKPPASTIEVILPSLANHWGSASSGLGRELSAPWRECANGGLGAVQIYWIQLPLLWHPLIWPDLMWSNYKYDFQKLDKPW